MNNNAVSAVTWVELVFGIVTAFLQLAILFSVRLAYRAWKKNYDILNARVRRLENIELDDVKS
jgi:hypothetical protein